MPRFGGFNIGSIGGALGRNALGTIANAVLPRTVFGGFGLADTGTKYGNQNAEDRMVSLRPKAAAANRVYGNGLLLPLKSRGGLVWPYTPSITYQHPITYAPVEITHANQDFHIFSRTPAVNIGVTGEFTVQNQQEGAYAHAAIHFLRTMAKMNFGQNDPQAGTPPPVLLFNAYGPFMFKDVPVIIKDFNVEFPQDVDYVQVTVSGVQTTTTTTPSRTTDTRITAEPLAPPPPLVTGRGTSDFYISGRPNGFTNINNPGEFGTNRSWGTVSTTPGTTTSRSTATQYTVWLPSVFKITCNMTIQHTPDELRKRFNLPTYINGANNQKDFV
jgi:hypothetical protein